MKRLNAFRRSSILVIMMILGPAMAGEAQVTIKEQIEITDGDTEFQAGTQTGKKPWNLTGSASEAIQPATYFACDVLPNDPSYVPCPTVLELADWEFPCPCSMSQGTCEPPPYTWIASMNNHDTTAMTFTFQDEQTNIQKPGVYNEGAGAFLIDLALVSHNWFGVADFSVTLYNGSGVTCGRTNNYIVKDDDNDLIADACEDSTGGRALDNPGLTCSSPSPACSDGDWDKDPNPDPDIIAKGDGISKLQEYRGVRIGAGYHRLTPEKMEVFLDYGDNPYGDSAKVEIETQLKLDVITVDGLIGVAGDTLVSGMEPRAGPKELDRCLGGISRVDYAASFMGSC